MAKQTGARPVAATARPPRPRASVPAFGGWEVAGGAGSAAAAPDYSLDFTNIRAARMQQRRTKALSWSSFVGNNAAVAVDTSPGAEEEEEEEKRRHWSSASASDDDDDRERRRRHVLRRLRSADIDDRLPIQPRRAAPPKGRGKLKGYLFGCVAGQW